jgi:hypothetical protein
MFLFLPRSTIADVYYYELSDLSLLGTPLGAAVSWRGGSSGFGEHSDVPRRRPAILQVGGSKWWSPVGAPQASRSALHARIMPEHAAVLQKRRVPRAVAVLQPFFFFATSCVAALDAGVWNMLPCLVCCLAFCIGDYLLNMLLLYSY